MGKHNKEVVAKENHNNGRFISNKLFDREIEFKWIYRNDRRKVWYFFLHNVGWLRAIELPRNFKWEIWNIVPTTMPQSSTKASIKAVKESHKEEEN